MVRESFEQAILKSRLKVPLDSESDFSDWQARYHERIAGFEGFIGLEISRSTEESTWEMIQRFDRPERLQRWIDSSDRRRLIEALKTFSGENEDLFVNEHMTQLSDEEKGVVEVIMTDVNPVYSDAYRAWIGRIHAAESKFPGFRKVYVQAPSRNGTNWVTFLQFDTIENLDRWLNSAERKRILSESETFVKKIESHRIASSFSGWFAPGSELSAVPPVWKQTLLVLLVLFPIVMLELQYLSPLLTGLHLSPATFIGNAISVSLISWPMMPICIRCLRRWLNPGQGSKGRKITVLGTILIFVLYGIEILFFRYF